jgi:hypothetical protein
LYKKFTIVSQSYCSNFARVRSNYKPRRRKWLPFKNTGIDWGYNWSWKTPCSYNTIAIEF